MRCGQQVVKGVARRTENGSLLFKLLVLANHPFQVKRIAMDFARFTDRRIPVFHKNR